MFLRKTSTEKCLEKNPHEKISEKNFLSLPNKNFTEICSTISLLKLSTKQNLCRSLSPPCFYQETFSTTNFLKRHHYRKMWETNLTKRYQKRKLYQANPLQRHFSIMFLKILKRFSDTNLLNQKHLEDTVYGRKSYKSKIFRRFVDWNLLNLVNPAPGIRRFRRFWTWNLLNLLNPRFGASLSSRIFYIF